MPVLPDSRREAFAQALAKGKSQTEAYAMAGYNAHRQNAARLMTNEAVQRRVAELQEAQAKKIIDSSAFEAKSMFEALLQDIVDAKAAGDHKTASDLRKFMIRCFGYEDSPTLTHEHVKGQKIPLHDKPAGEGEGESPAPAADAGNVTHLVDAINKLRKRA